jgi:hypothetical protein
LLYGQWAYHCLRAEHRLALSNAERLEQWGEARQDTVALMLGHFANAATHLWQGDFVAARAIFDQCRGMDDPGRRAAYEAATGADQHLVMLSHLAQNLTYLGHIDQGRALASSALSEARRSGHAFSIAFMSSFAALAQPPHCLLLHEPNLSPEVWSTAVMSLILFVADSSGGGAGENSD